MKRDLENIGSVPCDDPFFLTSIFFDVLNSCDDLELQNFLDLKKEAELSFFGEASGLQDSLLFRFKRRAFIVAKSIIDEKGDLKRPVLSRIIHLLEEKGNISYPGSSADGFMGRHLLSVLKKIEEDPSIYQLIRKFKVPLCHHFAEQIIKDSLGFEEGSILSDVDLRVSILAACLMSLRQSVGSCFATAPAILIQSEQLENLLKDLYELLMTGKIKRTFGGAEFSVPLSPSSGAGDLLRLVDFSNPNFLRSPSLVAAFQSVDLDLNELAKPFLAKQTGKMRLLDFIHEALLIHFGLKEEEIVLYEKMQKNLAQTRGLGGSFIGYLTKEKTRSLDLLQKKERTLKTIFKCWVDHPLLKVWEFTLASFSEIKMEFSRWNLYQSLGMHHEEESGIGEVIYRTLEKKLEESNRQVAELQTEYEIAFDQLRATESLLKRASSEEEGRRLQAEHTARLHHMQACLDRRNKCHQAASWCSSFFPFLMKEYDAKFQEYFQEIYDADMHDVQVGQYEDSPAGFRLVYKHGRSNASLWTMIYTPEQYIQVLTEFFLAVESQIGGELEGEDAVLVLSDVTTAVVSHVQTDGFLRSAILRMAKAHGGALPKDPLLALDKMEKKPWAYTSGGTMTTLLKAYYRREAEVTEESKWVESETDLLIFILDVFKKMPFSVEEKIVQQGTGILMYSPSHAFILYPDFPFLRKGWQENMFTYSWVRDQVIVPRRQFYASLSFSLSEKVFLLEEFSKKIPGVAVWLKSVECLEGGAVKDFRSQVITSLKGQLIDQVDSFLYEMLPLTSIKEWKEAVVKLLSEYPQQQVLDLLDLFSPPKASFLGAKVLREIAQAVLLLIHNTVTLSFDVDQYIAKKAESIFLAPPEPLLFADTNWTGYYFAFLVNPGTGELELWRVSPTGLQGVPMTAWKHWLDGRDKGLWHICSSPFEYA